MPAISRIGDTSSGHGCFEPTVMISSPIIKTFINGKIPGAVSEQCLFEPHSCGTVDHEDIERSPKSGTKKTFFEGFALVRIADPLNCGDIVGEGSPNTFIE